MPKSMDGVHRREEQHTRIERYARRLRQELRSCTNRELEILVRYYTLGQDADRVAREMRCGLEEIHRLRRRIRSAVREEQPAVQTAAAGR